MCSERALYRAPLTPRVARAVVLAAPPRDVAWALDLLSLLAVQRVREVAEAPVLSALTQQMLWCLGLPFDAKREQTSTLLAPQLWADDAAGERAAKRARTGVVKPPSITGARVDQAAFGTVERCLAKHRWNHTAQLAQLDAARISDDFALQALTVLRNVAATRQHTKELLATPGLVSVLCVAVAVLPISVPLAPPLDTQLDGELHVVVERATNARPSLGTRVLQERAFETLCFLSDVWLLTARSACGARACCGVWRGLLTVCFACVAQWRAP